MPNKLLFSVRYFSKIMTKYLFLFLSMLAFLYLFRMNLYFLSVYHAVKEAVPMDIYLSFWAGMRFDLAVLAWMILPLVILLIVQALFIQWNKGLFIIHKIYFSLFWLGTCVLSVIDFTYFSQTGKRIDLAVLGNMKLEILYNWINSLPQNNGWVYLGVAGFILLLGFWLVWGLNFGSWKDEYSPHRGGFFEMSFRLLTPIIFLLFIAHGNYSPEGLGLTDAEVSTFAPINEMALNPIFKFIKQLL